MNSLPINPLMEQLHDIEGIDPSSYWPLALGWWLVMLIVLILTFLLAFFIWRRLAYKRSWKSDALKQLHTLEKELTETTARETATALSEFMRRIAITRFSRDECAGLIGERWLEWLTAHDPRRFDWQKKGKALVDIPYAPQDRSPTSGEVKEILQAIKRWVY